MHIKRTWKICTDSNINNIYDDVWAYISNEYDIDDCPYLYLNNSKSVHLLGLYTWDISGECAVVLNAELLQHPKDILNTILHELCHHIATTLYKTNCHHDYRWKEIARHVGAHYRENITIHCASDNETLKACKAQKGLRKTQDKRWIVRCTTCNHEFTYQKKTWWIAKLAQHEGVDCKCPYCKQNHFEVKEIIRERF